MTSSGKDGEGKGGGGLEFGICSSGLASTAGIEGKESGAENNDGCAVEAGTEVDP